MKKRKKVTFKVLTVLLLFIVVLTAISNTFITTTEYTISSENLPYSFNNFKIIQLSDLHSKVFGKDNMRLIAEVDKQSPDVVVMTGDMVNTRDKDYSVFLSLAKSLAEKYDVYYIVGNHEQNLIDRQMADLIKHIESLGIVVLDNEKKVIEKNGESINLYGLWFNLRYYRNLKDEYTRDYYFGIEQMKKVLGDCDKGRFNVVLTHNPVFFDTYSEWGTDLVLSGHIHGGMIRIPFIGGLFSPEKEMFPKYDSGVFENKDSFLIVSRGLGNGDIGFRFLNCPELTVITLKSESLQ